jgi:hypothetical protein
VPTGHSTALPYSLTIHHKLIIYLKQIIAKYSVLYKFDSLLYNFELKILIKVFSSIIETMVKGTLTVDTKKVCQISIWGDTLGLHYVPLLHLKGQSHEKFGKMSVWGISLGPN